MGLSTVYRNLQVLADAREIETLRSEDGDSPAAMPQVWDSPARLKAFARATRPHTLTALTVRTSAQETDQLVDAARALGLTRTERELLQLQQRSRQLPPHRGGHR